jgi:ribosomal protein S18 acetylase RimI-like enzyme
MDGMPAFELVILNETDLDALLDLCRRCEDFLALGPQPYASAEMVLADLALSRENKGVFYGIYTGGNLCGVLDLTESGWQDSPEAAYISLLMLAREARGLGLGSRVLAYIEQRLQKQGIRRLCAGVQVNNPLAIRFWLAHGFLVVSEPILHPDGTTAVEIEKQTGV